MSLIVTVHVPEGIVMASDSRQSIVMEGKSPEGKPVKVETVNSDSVEKTFFIESHQVGISFFGQDLLGGVSTASHVKKFMEQELAIADDVSTIAKKIIDYFRKDYSNVDTGFHIAGYAKQGKISTPYFYYGHLKEEQIERRNIKDEKTIYGATWSGQIDILSSIVQAVIIKDEKGEEKFVRLPAPIIWDAMTLQDAIDFTIYAIRTTIETMRFQARPKNVGGPIDVLLLTPDNKGMWIQRKLYHGNLKRGSSD